MLCSENRNKFTWALFASRWKCDELSTEPEFFQSKNHLSVVMCNQNNIVTRIALAFPVDSLLPFPMAIKELHASLDKAVRTKEFISHQVVLACSESPVELQTNHCQFWQRASCWPTHFPESWGVTRARCSRRHLLALFTYSRAKEWFCLTWLEPQQAAAATPGPCAALYDILNYSTEGIDIPTDTETPRARLQTPTMTTFAHLHRTRFGRYNQYMSCMCAVSRFLGCRYKMSSINDRMHALNTTLGQ